MTTKYNKSFLGSMLEDSCDGSVSSKRVITLLAFLLCSLAFVCDLFWDKTVSPEVFDGMIYLAIAGLGFTASEKFAGRYKRSDYDTSYGSDSELDGPVMNDESYHTERNIRKNVSRRTRHE